jgi:hypothetical protein
VLCGARLPFPCTGFRQTHRVGTCGGRITTQPDGASTRRKRDTLKIIIEVNFAELALAAALFLNS